MGHATAEGYISKIVHQFHCRRHAGLQARPRVQAADVELVACQVLLLRLLLRLLSLLRQLRLLPLSVELGLSRYEVSDEDVRRAAREATRRVGAALGGVRSKQVLRGRRHAARTANCSCCGSHACVEIR